MHTPLSTIMIRFAIVIIGFLLIDLYVFKGLKTIISSWSNERLKQYVGWIYWGINLLFIVLVLYVFLTYNRGQGPTSKLFPWLAGILILMIVPKLIFSLFLLVEDVLRLFTALVLFVKSFFITSTEKQTYFEGRRQFISQLAALIASIPFFSILYGITKGKYNYKVHRVTVEFNDLPAEFDGFTITQLSDIHAGSFDNEDAVRYGVELANAQKSDLFLFTGDLVNNMSNEMLPWIDIFKTLHAPYGKFSVFGNHDYGDYIEWDSAKAKFDNLEQIKQVHKDLGFRLLLNENVNITKSGKNISLIGVENWGFPPFPQHGDLNKALEGVPVDAFKLLMSHDPSHWDAIVKKHPVPIHLTMAGHTHGMQFGIEIPGFKWSPIKYRYPKWAGLYQEGKKYLYVNRGFGFIGFPGRVGIWPEITVITLRKT